MKLLLALVAQGGRKPAKSKHAHPVHRDNITRFKHGFLKALELRKVIRVGVTHGLRRRFVAAYKGCGVERRRAASAHKRGRQRTRTSRLQEGQIVHQSSGSVLARLGQRLSQRHTVWARKEALRQPVPRERDLPWREQPQRRRCHPCARRAPLGQTARPWPSQRTPRDAGPAPLPLHPPQGRSPRQVTVHM